MEIKRIDTTAVEKIFGNTNLAVGSPERPLITFVLFSYNQEDYIRQAIEGAFSQAYSPLEIIISDDCSTDQTYEIINELASRYQGRHKIRVERNRQNSGKDAFGKRVWQVLKKARGELIVIAAGDDISLPNRCDVLFSVWDSHGRGRMCIHSNVFLINQKGDSQGISVASNHIAQCSLAEFVSNDGRGLLGATNAVSRSLVNSFGPLANHLLLEDGALAFRARLYDGILFSEDCLVKYRRHSENMSASAELMSQASLQRHSIGLMSQQAGYLSDYLMTAANHDTQVIRRIAKRLLEADLVRHFKTGNILQRLRAGFLFSRSFSMKRKIWLSLYAMGLFKFLRRQPERLAVSAKE